MSEITLINIGKRFGDKEVLRHVNLTLPEGETTPEGWVLLHVAEKSAEAETENK
jgi:hypothetical protein